MHKKEEVTNPILVMSSLRTPLLLEEYRIFDLNLRALLLEAKGQRKRKVV